MRKYLFRITKDMFPMVRDRYPYIYLEHGRLEIDDSSVKWISSQNEIIRLPVAVINSIFLGPGTSVTHAAVSAMSAAGCTICWIGEESLKFYAYGMPPTADTRTLYRQVKLAMNDDTRVKVARKMFGMRFVETDLHDKSLQALMGMEGQRVRAMYADYGERYGVQWNGRRYIPGKYERSDAVNKCLTLINGLLYGVLTSAILSAGYSPRVGFVHAGSPMPFVYDVADLYKEKVCVDLAFGLVAKDADVDDYKVIIEAFCERLVDAGVLERVVRDIEYCLDVE